MFRSSLNFDFLGINPINEKEDFDSTPNEEKELERSGLDNNAVVGHLQLDFVAEELSCCYVRKAGFERKKVSNFFTTLRLFSYFFSI
jgi:hypothetical protein